MLKFSEKKKKNDVFIILLTMRVSLRHFRAKFNTIEPRHEKTWFSHMRTTKAQISLCIRAV